MSQYVLRRVLIAIPSLLGISAVLFFVLALAPGDPFSELATNPNVPPEVQAALRTKFGLDDPIYIRYLHWLAAMAQGDWGFSFVSRMNVDTLILQRLPAPLSGVRSPPPLGRRRSCWRWRSPFRSASMPPPGPIRSSTRSPTPSRSSASRCRPSSPASCSS